MYSNVKHNKTLNRETGHLQDSGNQVSVQKVINDRVAFYSFKLYLCSYSLLYHIA